MTGTPNQLIDRPASARASAPADLLADVLATVRLAGAIFPRGEDTLPWAHEPPRLQYLGEWRRQLAAGG